MTRETELKYEADAGTELPRLDKLPGVRGVRGPDLQQLEAEYYDTADLRLLQAGITLRRRKGGHDAGWHLKLPAGTDSRDEIRVPLGRAGRVPRELAEMIKARTHGDQLVPVASITTLRQTTTLLGAGDEGLADIADDEVHGTAKVGKPTRWREIEVELTGGNRALLRATDKVLRQAGIQRSARSAKLERALGRTARSAPPRVTARSEASDVVVIYLKEHADRLMSLDPMVRRNEPDAVHRMRVATRRLRSTLRSFGSVITDGDTGHLSAELKWLGSVLGEQRDAEVQARRLEQLAGQTDAAVLLGPVQARIRAHFAKSVATSHAAVLAALDSGRYYAMLAALDALMAGQPAGPDASCRAGTVLPAAVRRSYRTTRRRMEAALQEPAGPARDTALHAARRAAKRTRYAAEAAVPVAGKPARRLARQMKKVQSVLGGRQDTVVGRRLSRQLGISAHLAAESAFSYGLFYGNDACAAERADARAVGVWRRASRARYREWLR
jgi:inorganic triphosphatase YgiF